METDQKEVPPHAARLRAARAARFKNARQAALATGFAASSWSDWENGVIPPADKAALIASTLDTTVEHLWGDRIAQAPANVAHTASDFTLAPELDDERPISLDIQAGAGV